MLFYQIPERLDTTIIIIQNCIQTINFPINFGNVQTSQTLKDL